jgi:hypothetical protein
MIAIHKKPIVDGEGKPMEVIIPWAEFLEISELLGMDLDKTARQDLALTHADRVAKNRELMLAWTRFDNVVSRHRPPSRCESSKKLVSA